MTGTFSEYFLFLMILQMVPLVICVHSIAVQELWVLRAEKFSNVEAAPVNSENCRSEQLPRSTTLARIRTSSDVDPKTQYSYCLLPSSSCLTSGEDAFRL